MANCGRPTAGPVCPPPAPGPKLYVEIGIGWAAPRHQRQFGTATDRIAGDELVEPAAITGLSVWLASCAAWAEISGGRAAGSILPCGEPSAIPRERVKRR
jgi:hypothetical protein